MSKTWRMAGPMLMALFVSAGVGCASRQKAAARSEGMSAEAHEQAAAKLAARANDEAEVSEREAPPPNVAVNPGGNPRGYYYPVSPSVPMESRGRAERLERHAQQHLEIATGMKVFEEDACREIPAAERSACPLLGPIAFIEDIPGGVRAHFTAKAHVDAIAAEIRCHLAYARARGFQQVASCPLYVRGLAMNRSGGGDTIDLVSADPAVAAEVRKRAREEAVLARDGSP
jgi:hypothetical protein